MTVYVHTSGQRVRPAPGTVEHARLDASPNWTPEDAQPAEPEPAADDEPEEG